MAYNLSPIESTNVTLTMEYVKGGLNKWAIKTHYGRSRHTGPTILFPSLSTLEKLWEENAPGRNKLLLALEGHHFPLIDNTLYVGGGRNSTAEERGNFLKAVLKGSSVATRQLPGQYNPGPL